METVDDARDTLTRSWPLIVDECRAVLGGELHYQAVIYHCLRLSGAPRAQIGMNVKQWIVDPITSLFIQNDLRKHQDFRGGFEPIPDIVLFRPEIGADWRRRNHVLTLRHMLLAIEVKASERLGRRLRQSEIVADCMKLAAHREEVQHRGSVMLPVVIVVDTAPNASERMHPDALEHCKTTATGLGIRFMYVSNDQSWDVMPEI